MDNTDPVLTIDVISPHTNESVGKLPDMKVDEVGGLIDKAHTAFLKWKETTISDRAEIVMKAIDSLEHSSEEIAHLLEQEIAKDIEAGKKEIERSVEYTKFTVSATKDLNGEVFFGDSSKGLKKGQKTGYSSRVPLGVILAITPFNYPVNLAITKIVPALMMGNSLVLKPPVQGGLASTKLFECFIKSGVPEGVLTLVTGRSSGIGDYLVTHPKISMIAFTGSTVTGHHIAEVSKGKVPLLMEMGGKDSSIVLSDADIELALDEIVKGAFTFCGQRCTATKRVFVESEIAQEFIERIVEKSKTFKVGPLISSVQKDLILAMIEDAKANGAREVLGGQAQGNIVLPTILTGVNENAKLFYEEQFGPVLPITIIQNVDQAVNWINTSRYGLQSSVFTRDIDKAFSIAEKIDTGTVQINAACGRYPDNFPFVGVRDSGIGLPQGTKDTLLAMSRQKLTVINKKV
ncbi:aldehyde dehydrogenase family protein [Candidatus Dojkabacteria bacterium]|nr:aldehyde dehydrogenase family protein [Candidatus Dojkabacteria bacterium]